VYCVHHQGSPLKCWSISTRLHGAISEKTPSWLFYKIHVCIYGVSSTCTIIPWHTVNNTINICVDKSIPNHLLTTVLLEQLVTVFLFSEELLPL
jgi:hypothetical protein